MAKNIVFILLLSLFAMYSCNKSKDSAPPTNQNPPPDSTDSTNTTDSSFITYLIKAGNNYMEGNTYPPFAQSSMKFQAIFDSSCIYTTTDPNDQADICKLMGFADSNTFHQQNSARFGWNWMNGQMHIHGYTYVSTTRIYKELGTVPLNTIINCELDVIPGKYIFILNGKRDTMQRSCMDTIAVGYKLYPYFGGNEPAPHDIRIKIKELN